MGATCRIVALEHFSVPGTDLPSYASGLFAGDVLQPFCSSRETRIRRPPLHAPSPPAAHSMAATFTIAPLLMGATYTLRTTHAPNHLAWRASFYSADSLTQEVLMPLRTDDEE